MGDPRAAGCAEEPKVAGEPWDAKAAGETQASAGFWSTKACFW